MLRYKMMLLLCVTAASNYGLQQPPPSAADVREEQLSGVESSSAAGRWRDDVIDLQAQADDQSPGTRGQRNAYWHSHLPPANGTGSLGSFPPGASELIPSSPSLWVVATFTSYKVFEPSPGDGAYTDVRFSVDQILANRTQAPISAGNVIDVGEPGGSIRGHDGQAHHYNLHYQPYTLQPGHKYLLQLQYFKDGNFFRRERAWDLTSGVAVPLGMIEVTRYRMAEGTLIGGKSSPTAIRNAQILLSQAPPKSGAK